MSDQPTWQFPPRGIGIEVIQDSASAHFRDDPIRKLVREALQNSLDAKEHHSLSPVEVNIGEKPVPADLIGGAELRRHLISCRDRAKEANRPKVQAIYDRALQALSTEQIRCLQIVDSGTTGLKGDSWDALVTQEGSVSKAGDAPGGSNGIGKNAVLNVSDLRTVFYSTRYLDPRENKGGRVEKFQGKATLMSHPDPFSVKSLQHIGFFAMPGGFPVYTREIPDFFRLGAIGTGVFVMGFNPRSAEWVKEVTAAVIENFFYAVHHKKLVVKVASPEFDGVLVNHETLDWLFESHSAGTPSHYYYKAIRDRQPFATDSIGKIGPVEVYLSLGGGPRRTAYINHNGMLITDSREQKTNPVAPKGRGRWPDFAAVVTPDTVAGDEWVRQTENPSHDAMSPWKLDDDKECREADRVFKEARDAIRKIIDTAAQIEKDGDTSNLNELASLLPDEFDPSAPGNRLLKTQIRNDRTIQSSFDPFGSILGPLPEPRPTPVTNTDPKPDPDHDPDADPKPDPDPDPDPKPRPKPEPRPRPSRPPRLLHPRIIPVGSSSATVSFTLTEDKSRLVRLALTPAGGEWGHESQIGITEASVISPQGQDMNLDKGIVSLIPPANERVIIKISTSVPLSDLAFRLV